MAEGAPLLREYVGKTCIKGSNPFDSARPQVRKGLRARFSWCARHGRTLAGPPAQVRIQPKPCAYLNDRGLPQGNRSQLASLAVQMHAGATVQNDIHHATPIISETRAPVL